MIYNNKRNSKFAIYFTAGALLVSVLLFLSFNTERSNRNESTFSIAFLTDIHLRPELNAVQGFKQAIEDVNKKDPDFVITGGDLVGDALAVNYERADLLYDLYEESILNFRMPVYNTIGNHDLYGINVRIGSDSLHPEYGVKMFEKRLAKTYYSFEHRGWKFMILNSIKETKKYGTSEDGEFPSTYIGMIDNNQIEWIKAELARTDPNTPIVLSTHIPLITVYTQRYFGTTVQNEPSQIVGNAKEVIELFNGNNLKLVLQGHLHSVEDIFVGGVHFLTGGAVCGSWWQGPSHTGFEEGYMYVTFKDDEFEWQYIDYGWDVDKEGQ